MTGPFVLGLVGSLATLVFVFEMLRRRRLREKYAVLWVTVALASLVLSAFPSTLSWAAATFGVEVPANLLFFGALLLLLLTNIQHSYEVGRLEEKTRTLAEEIALLKLDQKPLGDGEGRQ